MRSRSRGQTSSVTDLVPGQTSGAALLHYAAFTDNIGTINLLLGAGADPLKANNYGHTAMEYAKDKNSKQLIRRYAEKYEYGKKKLKMEEDGGK